MCEVPESPFRSLQSAVCSSRSLQSAFYSNPCEQDSRCEQDNRIVACEQDSRREQNSPRYSGDYLVYRGLSCLREQDSHHEHCMASVNMQNSRREQDSRL